MNDATIGVIDAMIVTVAVSDENVIAVHMDVIVVTSKLTLE